VTIGIDARKLWDGGIGTYIRGLTAALLRAGSPHSFVAFVRPEDRGVLGGGDLDGGPGAGGPGGGGRAVPALDEVPVRAGKYSLAEHFVIPRAARAAGVELLHAPHYTLPLGWSGPSVVTIHDLIHVRHARFFRPGTALAARALAGAAARRARLVLTGSTHSRDEITSLLGIPAEKIRVTPYGVSSGFSRRSPEAVGTFRAARRLPGSYVLYVGARKRHKNVEVLLRALSAMPRDSRPPLVLSGPRWRPGEPLARSAARAGVADGVFFSGPLTSDEDLSLLYSGAAVYLQPSLDEGFGLPPLEAMACGVPVVASPAGALRETLAGAAEWASPDRADAWAEAIAALLEDPARREERAARGLKHARAFTWDRTAAMTLDAYREAAGDA
jgi:glycosyltransferase involved in cell wall biosynthesis